MAKNKTTLIKGGDEDDENLHPLQRPSIRSTVGRGLERALNNIQFGVQEWLEEARATAQAASISGDFESAFKYYEMLGKSIGAIQDPKAQHLHVHNNTSHAAIQEMSTEELTARHAELKRQRAIDDADTEQQGRLADLLG